MLRSAGLLAVYVAFLCANARAADTADKAGGDEPGRIAKIFSQYDRPDSPGCAVGVIREGKLIQASGFGMANLEHGIANGPTIVYDIGSTSKQFTAASILLLEQRGKLTLDDDVRKFIPELPQYQRPITLRHLLNHTSGLRDYLGLFSLAGMNFEDTTTEQDAFDFIVRQKTLNFPPGDDFLYSNSGYLLLSVIVRRVSGQSLAEFAKANIFDPLGMSHTLILDRHRRIVPHRATAYSRNAAGELQIQMSNFEQTGDGAVQTSIEDLAKWDRNFYEPTVGGREWLERMHATGTLRSGAAIDYAAGLYVQRYQGLRRVNHQGAWAGYRADLIRFPDQRLSVACICNAGGLDVTDLAMQVAALYLQKELAPIAATAKPGRAESSRRLMRDADRYPGLYRSVDSGELRRVSFADGKLMIDAMSTDRRELTPVAANRFTTAAGSVLEFKSVGDTRQLRLERLNRGMQIFERVEQVEPAPDDLAEYAGRYFSEELNVAYQISLDQQQLQVANPSDLKRPLVPTFRDGFIVASGSQVEFARDPAGRVTGFSLTAGRIRHIKFSRQP